MRVCVIGAGYVGLTTAAVLAGMGTNVIAVENNEKVLRNLKCNIIPFYESALEELVNKTHKSGFLMFSGDIETAAYDADIIIIAVGTPANETGECDLKALDEVAARLSMISKTSHTKRLAVIKSTVPVGTCDLLEERLNYGLKEHLWEVASNPEFLRQGCAIDDIIEADRIIIGVASKKAADTLCKLYKPLNRKTLITDRRSAEMIKYASNVFLASKISYINEIAALCEKTGADVKIVAEGLALDRRIGGGFLKAGIGFGGSCLPKDLACIVNTAKQHGLSLPLIESIKEVNDRQLSILPEKLGQVYSSLSGVNVCVWGITFKPGTDDIRDAPSVHIIDNLIKKKCCVKVFDPMDKAREKIKEVYPEIESYKDPYDAAKDSAAILLLTEWDLFREINWKKLRGMVKTPLILDGRNFIEHTEVKKEGFVYMGIGRGGVSESPVEENAYAVL